MTTLPLAVLVHEGPMARAYLAVLAAAGFRVERIVLMIARRDPARRQTVAPWLPVGLRRRVAALIQDQQTNHWPRVLSRQHRELCRLWWQELASAWAFPAEVFEQLIGRMDYRAHADAIDEVFIDGLADPALRSHLQGLQGRQALLYTGGGIVPASLLGLERCRFIHVHPGTLPHVRGADGLLWSLVLRGRPGATAFYMDAGLDTGDVILARDFDLPPVPRAFADLDTATAYRMLYAFVDPLLRAVLLRELVRSHPHDLSDLPTSAQSPDEGTTFRFMNPRMRRFAFQRFVTLAHEPAGPLQGQIRNG